MLSAREDPAAERAEWAAEKLELASIHFGALDQKAAQALLRTPWATKGFYGTCGTGQHLGIPQPLCSYLFGGRRRQARVVLPQSRHGTDILTQTSHFFSKIMNI